MPPGRYPIGNSSILCSLAACACRKGCAVLSMLSSPAARVAPRASHSGEMRRPGSCAPGPAPALLQQAWQHGPATHSRAKGQLETLNPAHALITAQACHLAWQYKSKDSQAGGHVWLSLSCSRGSARHICHMAKQPPSCLPLGAVLAPHLPTPWPCHHLPSRQMLAYQVAVPAVRRPWRRQRHPQGPSAR